MWTTQLRSKKQADLDKLVKIYREMKSLLVYLSILFISILATLPVLELILRQTSWLDQVNNPSPSYIPESMFQNYSRADDGFLDKSGFRVERKVDDLLVELSSHAGCKVVTLGDSFIWGSGLSVSKSWPSKLAKLTKCRVFPFGKPGWSSYHYFEFYRKHLIDKSFEYLLVGIVANDPHPLGSYLQFQFDNNYYHRRNTNVFEETVFEAYFQDTYAYKYLQSVLGGFIDSRKPSAGKLSNPPITNWGYVNWKERLYEPDIFEVWLSAVNEFSTRAKHSPCFLLTPTSNTPLDRMIFQKIAEKFDGIGLEYENMMLSLDQLYSRKLRPRTAWANPSDGHPGDAQTSLYAQGAKSLLKRCAPSSLNSH